MWSACDSYGMITPDMLSAIATSGEREARAI